MKTLLSPCILNFLKTHGYQYFVSQKTERTLDNSIEHILLVPLTTRPVLSKIFVGYDTCFHITDSDSIGLFNHGTQIRVLLSKSDILNLKRYLLTIFK